MKTSRRFLAPEVIQIASIDCGPACLTSVFAGYGLDVGYDALRDACQTDIDGTSIDALGVVANQLGVRAQQIWLPVDHLTIGEVSPLPAILVTQTRGGAPHFVVAWRQVGNLVQIMDPSAGRSWVTRDRLASMIFPYQLGVAARVWHKWARSAEFDRAMTERLARIGAAPDLLAWAKGHPSGASLSSLDAACRMVETLIRSGAVRKGKESRDLAAALVVQAILDVGEGAPTRTIPESFFAALPLDAATTRVKLAGAILLRLRGRKEPAAAPTRKAFDEAKARSRRDHERRPWLEALRFIRKEGGLTLGVLAWTLLVASAVAFFEALLLRGLLDMDSKLQGIGQRAIALAAFASFLVIGTAFDLWSTRGARAVGRRFELRLRTLLLAKIPLLGDAYFRSRPAADFAHRFHVFHPVRNVPILAGRIARLTATLVATVFGLIWLDPRGLVLTLVTAVACVAIPWLGQSLLAERDLKVRIHDARLAQFNLDALLGLLPIRAHGAEPTIRGEHSSVVLEWVNACRQRLRVSVGVDVLQSIASALLSIGLVASYVTRSTNPGALLLLTYWALSLPSIGEEMAALTRQIPHFANLLTRVLDPIHAPLGPQAASEQTVLPEVPPYRTSATNLVDDHAETAAPATARHRGVDLVFDNVSVHVSGRTIMSNVDLRLRPGEHVAIVGPSGAGKSTLLSLLLGFHEATSGAIWIDRAPLAISRLRGRTAWVDPSISLWNRSLLENVRYGSEGRELDMTSIVERSELLDVLRRLPNGLESELGEGGRVVSGGEGQRVRLARAMTRPDADLVLLDEPFRGLERPVRERLMRRARELWKEATLLCVTHDVSQARAFDRVIVIERGTIVEQGAPEVLTAQGGAFQRLLVAEEKVHAERWNDPSWRKVRVASGAVVEAP
ncbi:MAG: ATP-binding cassette domain-containing protein [Deltaproteobacteria bacterium]|nr:ATP-binding cassette domain-containing protein [Deltaproteobacteria bacterium]